MSWKFLGKLSALPLCNGTSDSLDVLLVLNCNNTRSLWRESQAGGHGLGEVSKFLEFEAEPLASLAGVTELLLIGLLAVGDAPTMVDASVLGEIASASGRSSSS